MLIFGLRVEPGFKPPPVPCSASTKLRTARGLSSETSGNKLRRPCGTMQRQNKIQNNFHSNTMLSVLITCFLALDYLALRSEGEGSNLDSNFSFLLGEFTSEFNLDSNFWKSSSNSRV